MEYECKCNCGYITVSGFDKTKTVEIAQKNKCQCGRDYLHMTIQPMNTKNNAN